MDHNLNLAFDGVNTKFKLTYDDGTFNAGVTRAPQITVSVNGVSATKILQHHQLDMVSLVLMLLYFLRTSKY